MFFEGQALNAIYMVTNLLTRFAKIICSSVLLFVSVSAFAQLTPTITSFSPQRGPLGTIVTISGTNFNAASASNTVFFGAVKATSVTATSTTQLMVAVPKGASYHYISVTNMSTNLTAYSTTPFVVIFLSSSTADFSTDATVSPSGALLTYRMAIGDLNEDGKPDLVVVDNNAGTNANTNSAQPGNSNVYVFVNTSTSTGPISYSLNNTLTLPFNNGPAYTANHATTYNGSFAIAPAASDGSNSVTGVALKDMDGDGKLDVVITFKNEKIAGNTVNVNNNCTSMNVYITTYSTYKLAAFRNTTSKGSSSLVFGAPSLATLEGVANDAIVQQGSTNINNHGFCDSFSPGSAGGNGKSIRSWYPSTSPVTPLYLPFGRNITLADFDGDGKSDVAIARDGSAIGYLNSSTTGTAGVTSAVISVYRNTSTANNISFANSITFTVGGMVSYDLVAGNLDNKASGMPDMVVANDVGTLTVLQNKSIPGALSFTTATTLTSPSNPRAVALGDFDNDGSLDIAVANYGSGMVSLFRNTNVSQGTMSFPPTASLAITVGTNPFGLALGDINGDGKVDLAVENSGSGPTNGVQIFSNTTSGSTFDFTNIKPGVNYPTGLTPQGIVMGDMNNDGRADIAVTNNNTSISFLRNTVSITVLISSFTPTSGVVGTTVTITGQNFSLIPGSNVVLFGTISATVQAGPTSTSLIVTVPSGGENQFISVKNLDYNSTGYSAQPFIVKSTPTLTITSSNVMFLNTSMTATVTSTALNGGGGALVYSITNVSGVATTSHPPTNDLITSVTAGTVVLTVKSAGDTNYYPASATQTIQIFQAPGAVSAGMKLWLRADIGLNPTTGNVSRWDDQSQNITLNANQAAPPAGASTDIIVTPTGLNFNPVLTFSGASSKELRGVGDFSITGEQATRLLGLLK